MPGRSVPCWHRCCSAWHLVCSLCADPEGGNDSSLICPGVLRAAQLLLLPNALALPSLLPLSPLPCCSVPLGLPAPKQPLCWVKLILALELFLSVGPFILAPATSYMGLGPTSVILLVGAGCLHPLLCSQTAISFMASLVASHLCFPHPAPHMGIIPVVPM